MREKANAGLAFNLVKFAQAPASGCIGNKLKEILTSSVKWAWIVIKRRRRSSYDDAVASM